MKTAKTKLTYPLVLSILLGLLLLNVILVLALPDKAALTRYSYPPGILLIVLTIYGLCAIIDKHKGNYFRLESSRGRSFSGNKSYTYTEAYEREFRWSLLIYFGAMPFYLSLVFFCKKLSSLRRSLVGVTPRLPAHPHDPLRSKIYPRRQGAQADPGRAGTGAHRARAPRGAGEVEMRETSIGDSQSDGTKQMRVTQEHTDLFRQTFRSIQV